LRFQKKSARRRFGLKYWAMDDPGHRILYLREKIQELKLKEKSLQDKLLNTERDGRAREVRAGQLDTILGRLRIYSAELLGLEKTRHQEKTRKGASHSGWAFSVQLGSFFEQNSIIYFWA
jgi:hypothetical protein